MIKEETQNLNRSITGKKIELVIKKLSKMKIPNKMDSLVNFTHCSITQVYNLI